MELNQNLLASPLASQGSPLASQGSPLASQGSPLASQGSLLAIQGEITEEHFVEVENLLLEKRLDLGVNKYIVIKIYLFI